MADSLVLLLLLFTLLLARVEGARNVNITLLESAVAKGAVCLDGSAPAYAYLQGSGDGVNNWVVYIQGGGWCTSKHGCFKRSGSFTGSSSHILSNYKNKIYFDGILDDDAAYNPQFYNWNRFYILYCDGSSFMSDIEEVDLEHNVTYRGARVFDAMVEELFLRKGLAKAQNVLLTGSSAGGLTTILKCDKFRALFSNTTRVKCVSDSGFFIHGKDLIGADWREEQFFNVVSVHGLANRLPTSCTTKMNPALCLFAEYLVKAVQTPLFLVESAFNLYQIGHLIPPENAWDDCTSNTTTLSSLCNWEEFKIMKEFGATFIEILKKNLDNTSKRGCFVHSCYLHTHIYTRKEWMCSSLVGNNVLGNKSIGRAVGDWYLNEEFFQEIDMENDLPRICNNTLPKSSFEQKCRDII